MEILKREYGEVRNFLKQLKKFVLFSAVFFIMAAVAAYFVAAAIYSNNAELIKEHLGIFNNIIGSSGITDEQGNIDVAALFFNNFRASMMAIGAGMLPFVFAPLFNCATNGAVIGILFAILHSTEAGGISYMLVSIMPHGIFELSALVLSVAFGLKLCSTVNGVAMAKTEPYDIFQYIAEMARAAVLTVLPLLIIAAIIETYITPLCIEKFIG